MDNTLTFLTALFPTVPKGYKIKITHLGSRPVEFYAFNAEQVLSYLSTPKYQVNTYVGIVPTNKDRQYAPKWNVAWVDIDGYKQGVGKLPDFSIPPSMLVSSGRGVHAYWFLNEHIPLHEIELLNKKLMLSYGGDHCWNKERILRIVGTINRREGSSDSLCELLDASGPTYTQEQLNSSHNVSKEALSKFSHVDDGLYEDVGTTVADMPVYWKDIVFNGQASLHVPQISWVMRGDGTVDRSKLIFSVIKTAKEHRLTPDALWELYESEAPLVFEKLFNMSDEMAKRYIYNVYKRVEVTHAVTR